MLSIWLFLLMNLRKLLNQTRRKSLYFFTVKLERSLYEQISAHRHRSFHAAHRTRFTGHCFKVKISQRGNTFFHGNLHNRKQNLNIVTSSHLFKRGAKSDALRLFLCPTLSLRRVAHLWWEICSFYWKFHSADYCFWYLSLNVPKISLSKRKSTSRSFSGCLINYILEILNIVPKVLMVLLQCLVLPSNGKFLKLNLL